MTKASMGSIDAAYEYDDFGNTLRESGPYAASNPFRFSTKYTDIETGLVYYGHRFYSPSLGRFINKDTIEEQGGLNLYGFCGNDGVNRWDYLGMDEMVSFMGEWMNAQDRANRIRMINQPGYWGGSPNANQQVAGTGMAGIVPASGGFEAYGFSASMRLLQQVADQANASKNIITTDDGKLVKPSIRLGEMQVLGVVESASNRATPFNVPNVNDFSTGSLAGDSSGFNGQDANGRGGVPLALPIVRVSDSNNSDRNLDSLTLSGRAAGFATLAADSRGDLIHNELYWLQRNGTVQAVNSLTRNNYVYKRSFDLAEQRTGIAKAASKYFGYLGLGLTGWDMRQNGFTSQNTTDFAFGLLGFAAPVGTAVASAYFLTNFIYDINTPPLPPPKP